MSQMILNTGIITRQIAMDLIQAIPEELFDIQPPQFNNTIRWNVGHMVFCMDYFMSLALPFNDEVPDHYVLLFNTGTRPSEWNGRPPGKEELVRLLSGQMECISAIEQSSLEKKLERTAAVGPLSFEVAGEVVNFAFIHEAMHIGRISSLLKVIQYQ